MQALNLFQNYWNNRISNIILYCFPFFFIILADSILSFIFPIVVSDTLNSNTLMGLIMSLSSIAGLVGDFVLPQIFKRRSWRFFILAAISLALTFPISTYLGAAYAMASFFAFAAIVWGIYFEFLMFSEQLFVVNEDKKIDYSKDWGILSLTWQSSAIVGPIIGSTLLTLGILNTTAALLVLQTIALVMGVIVIKSINNKRGRFIHDSEYKSKLSILTELHYWTVLFRRVWPAVLLGIVTSSITATFWTIGGIFGEKIFGDNGTDWLIVSLYFLPMVLGSLIIANLRPKTHKKLYSQISLVVGSLILSSIFIFGDNNSSLLIIIVLGSFCLSFAQPLNEAVYSDLLERLGKNRSHLLGISRANASIAYIITPTLVGFLADKLGFINTFGVVASVSFVIGLLLILFTPKKIKLPQGELNQMSEVIAS